MASSDQPYPYAGGPIGTPQFIAERRRQMAEGRVRRQAQFKADFQDIMQEFRQLIARTPTPDVYKAITALSKRIYEVTNCTCFNQAAVVAQDIERLCAVGQKGHILTDVMLSVRFHEEAQKLQWAFDGGEEQIAKQMLGEDIGWAPEATLHPQVAKPLFLIDPDTHARHDLSTQLQCYNYRVIELSAPDDIEAAIVEHGSPGAIVLDIGTGDTAEANAKRIPELQHLCPTIPVLVLTERRDFEMRLLAAQMGSSGYQIKPIKINTLVDQLIRVSKNAPNEPYRVLIIDDDRAGNVFHQALLKEAGIISKSVLDSLSAFEAIEEFKPDVVLVDLYLPDWSGMDVAAAIRQHDDYFSLPILFISSETTRSAQLEAMRAGADDFIPKPVSREGLIDPITFRAQRYRDLRELLHRKVDVDGLTGALNHSAIVRHIDRELATAKRNNLGFCVAMIDIDELKAINDSHGHHVGDMVLSNLCNLFRQRLRSTDVVGRYGGEEFLILLPGTKKEAAVHTIDWLRQAFSTLEQRSSDAVFKCTFSCGVVEYPALTTVNELVEGAHRELGQAKASGRNRVFPVLAVNP